MPSACCLEHILGGKITALSAQKHNRERVNVHLDGQFAFGLAAIEAARLRVGQELSDADIRQLLARDEVEVALQRTLKYLAHRQRSESEVRQYLRAKGVPTEIQDELVERLSRVGLLDDAQFARFWIDNRQHFRPRSGKMLRYELRQKGLDPETIDAALTGMDDLDAAIQLATSQARRLAGKPWPEFRRKLGAYLARRGFSYNTSETAIAQAWAESHSSTDLSNELLDESEE